MGVAEVAALLGAFAALVTSISSAVLTLRYRARCARLERDRDDANRRLERFQRGLRSLEQTVEETGKHATLRPRRG